jgi:cyanophycin synthetase
MDPLSITDLLEGSSDRNRQLLEKALVNNLSIRPVSLKPTVFKLSNGSTSVLIYGGHLPLNSKASILAANNKHITKCLLLQVGLATPRGIVAQSQEEVLKMIQANPLAFPLVVKPVDGSYGVGITLDVQDIQALSLAIGLIESKRSTSKLLKSDSFIVEEMVSGRDYRVLILDGKVIACVERVPAHVVGDGQSSISHLIENFNAGRPRPFWITIDASVTALLAAQKYDLFSIPESGYCVKLRKNANVSMGGVPINKTAAISRRFQEICILSAGALDLRFAGVDIYTEDIASENTDAPYSILEVNANLIDYSIHEHPLINGESIDVLQLLLESLFPSLLNRSEK